jgi:hypothetical protein
MVVPTWEFSLPSDTVTFVALPPAFWTLKFAEVSALLTVMLLVWKFTTPLVP